MDEQYTHKIEYFLVLKREEIWAHASKGMNLEISQTQKNSIV